MSDDALGALLERVEQWTGIELHRGGRRASLKRFVDARVRSLKLRSAEAYAASLKGPEDPEVERIVGVVTVGHTWFFRDAGQMQAISALLENGFATGAARSHRRVQVWVPGCSTGEDAYTIALIAARVRRDVVIIGSDINSQALEHARSGQFGSWSIRELPVELRGGIAPSPSISRNVTPSRVPRAAPTAASSEVFEVTAEIRGRVRFERHNLLDAPLLPPDGDRWDLVICRNVLIYFGAANASAALERLSGALVPGGWLLVGASEVIHSPPPGMRLRTLGGRYGLQRDDGSPRVSTTPTPPSSAVRRPALGESRRDPVRRSSIPLPPRVAEPERETTRPDAAVVDALARAGAMLEAGDAERAVKLYGAVLDVDPLCAEARMFAGIAHHLRGDPASAVEELRRALFLDPDLWPAAFYLGLNYERLGLSREAQREYQRVVSMSHRIPSLRSRTSVLGDIAAWREEVVAVAKRRAQSSDEPPEAE